MIRGETGQSFFYFFFIEVLATGPWSDKMGTGNHRPISVLPIISELIEKALHDQLYFYITNEGLFLNSQLIPPLQLCMMYKLGTKEFVNMII